MTMFSRCRAIAPVGVPFSLGDILAGFSGSLQGESVLNEFRLNLVSCFRQRHIFFYSSGRAAICAALRAFGEMRPGKDEVAIPAYTSFSVPSAVVRAGFKVALYDVDPVTLSPDIESLKRTVNERTLCVMACHLFGYPVDMDAMTGVTNPLGIPVFDDAAQAMGARYRKRMVGTLGDIGLFSLSRGKNISTVDGGILVTRNVELAHHLEWQPQRRATVRERLKIVITALAMCLLLHPRVYWLPRLLPFLKLGVSTFDPEFPEYRLTSFQAGLGLRMLPRLESLNRSRRKLAEQIARAVTGCRLPTPVPGAEPVYLRLPLLNGAVLGSIPEAGVVPSYPSALGAVPELKPYIANDEPCPGAEVLAEKLLTLPTHEYVSGEDVGVIVRSMELAGGYHG